MVLGKGSFGKVGFPSGDAVWVYYMAGVNGNVVELQVEAQ